MNDKPLISILMNSHNGEKYLADSVGSLIKQSYQNWELIFYDNCSSDNTKKIINNFKDKRIKYFRSEKYLTLGQARKSAEVHLRGEFIGILDSDDIWLKNKIKDQIKYFNDDNVGLIFSASIFFNDDKEVKIFPYKKFIKKNLYFDLLNKYQIPLETILIRRKFLDNLNYKFDERFSSISDFDLLLRLSKICLTVYTPEITAKWRYHSDSDTNKYPLKFVFEKEIWIQEMLKKNDLVIKEIKILKKLRSKNISEKSRLLLIYNSRYEAFKNLFQRNNINLIWILTLLLIFFPFSKIFLKKRYNKGF